MNFFKLDFLSKQFFFLSTESKRFHSNQNLNFAGISKITENIHETVNGSNVRSSLAGSLPVMTSAVDLWHQGHKAEWTFEVIAHLGVGMYIIRSMLLLKQAHTPGQGDKRKGGGSKSQFLTTWHAVSRPWCRHHPVPGHGYSRWWPLPTYSAEHTEITTVRTLWDNHAAYVSTLLLLAPHKKQ